MKKHKKILLTGIILILMITVSVFSIRNSKKEYIDKVLSTKAYSYLSPAAKEYVKETYERTGQVILTEKNKKDNQPYLNPVFVDYLDYSDEEKII